MLIRCCPSSYSLKVDPSPSKTLFESVILPLCLLRVFRCEKCQRRYYGSVFSRRLPLHPQETRELSAHLDHAPLSALPER